MQNLLSLLLFLFVAILVIPACTRDTAPGADPIRFEELAVGQRSRYLGLDGKHYRSGDGSEFSYSDDTLVLEIVGQDAQGFKVAETLHYVDVVSEWYDADIDSTYFYYLSVSNDTLRIVSADTGHIRSRLFKNHPFLNRTPELPLANFTDPKVDIKGWKSSFDYCECAKTGFTRNYKLFGKKYPRLNVLMDDTFMQSDGPGHTYVYSAKYGVVKFSQYSWWTSDGYGWDLLPE